MKLPKKTAMRVGNEFAGADVPDRRLQRRAQLVAEKLARSASLSLPAAMGTDAELQGCYRLVNNPHVTFEGLLAGHYEETRKRAEQAGSVLVVHDTTEFSFPRLPGEELGFLHTGKAGFLGHVVLTVRADEWRRPLGVIYAETLHRDGTSKRGRRVRASGDETSKWEDRESRRWLRGMEAAVKALSGCDCVIHVVDREGDSYELLAYLIGNGQRFAIRSRVDRRGRLVDSSDAQWSKVHEIASACEGMLERDVPLSRRAGKPTPGMTGSHPPRKARLARLQFSAARVVIPRPRYLSDPIPEELELNLVHVTEVDAPADQPSVEWLLYTTEPIDTPEQVAAVVDTYRERWTIEEFFGGLKTGCAYEAREFESRHALLSMLALSLPIACEVLALRSRARSTPSAPATDVLSEQQLQILRTLGERPLSPRPTVEQALLAVAGLGGHLLRNGAPGWKVLQRGMALLLAYEIGWAAAMAAHGQAKM